jgi:hypothetical protein
VHLINGNIEVDKKVILLCGVFNITNALYYTHKVIYNYGYNMAVKTIADKQDYDNKINEEAREIEKKLYDDILETSILI